MNMQESINTYFWMEIKLEYELNTCQIMYGNFRVDAETIWNTSAPQLKQEEICTITLVTSTKNWASFMYKLNKLIKSYHVVLSGQ